MKMKTSVRQTADAVSLKKPYLTLIEHDLFGIAERLRDIEDGYFVMFNRLNGKYEVHSAYNKGNTYCFRVQYDALDSRTLDYCEQTLVKNKDRIMREIEECNSRIDEERRRDARNRLESASKETAYELTLAHLKDELHSGYRKTFGGISI